MKIVSWNINSIRARLERFTHWLSTTKPDIVCLQETKVTDPDFPLEAITALGYNAVFKGEKSYNGVAILSLVDHRVENVEFELPGQPEAARFIAATVNGIRIVNVYVPNGKEVGHESYFYKLKWLENLYRYLSASNYLKSDLILCGDFNVAPTDIDVHDPQKWHEQILCSSKERQALMKITDLGLVDSFRSLQPTVQQFSWWDYRELCFPKNKGLRIDLMFASQKLLPRIKTTGIEREERKGEKPSDHAPVYCEIGD